METAILQPDIAGLVLRYLQGQDLTKVARQFRKLSPYLHKEYPYRANIIDYSFLPSIEEIICEFIKINKKVDEVLGKLPGSYRTNMGNCSLSDKISELLKIFKDNQRSTKNKKGKANKSVRLLKVFGKHNKKRIVNEVTLDNPVRRTVRLEIIRSYGGVPKSPPLTSFSPNSALSSSPPPPESPTTGSFPLRKFPPISLAATLLSPNIPKPFKCPECGEEFTLEDSLKLHLDTMQCQK